MAVSAAAQLKHEIRQETLSIPVNGLIQGLGPD
jgi:hypothetical protein